MKYSVIDAHCDTAYELYKQQGDLKTNSLSFSLDKLTNYHSYIQFFAIWSDPAYKQPITEEVITYLKKQLKRYRVPVLFNRSDLVRHRCSKGLKCLLAVEGGEPIAEDLDNLDSLYHMGVRLLTLTWNGINAIGCGSMSGSEKGLTAFGKKVVERMNRLGMIIDVSHLNENGFYDVMELSKKPVMASHSNAKSVYPHKRNLSDAQFLRIVQNHGVIGLNIYPAFLGEDANLDTLIEHMEHFLSLGGENHIGLGTDFDGIDSTIPEMRNVSEIGNLIERLLQMNYSEGLIQKLLFENVYRVLYENLNN